MLKGVHDSDGSTESAGGWLLDEIVRDGARQMLAATLQAEVAVYIEAFATAYGHKWPKATAKITDDLDVLATFFGFPSEHGLHLRIRTTNPIESTFATVWLRLRVTTGSGSRATGVARAFTRIESAQARWRAVNAPHLVALFHAGATFENGALVERPDSSASNERVA